MYKKKLTAEEILHEIKLRMSYDSSKTLNENEKILSEQYVAPAAAATAAGAGLGAAAGAALPTSLAIGAGGTGAIGTGVLSGLVYSTAGTLGVGMATAGAIVGGAVALAVLPLVYWLVTKDTGANKVKKMFEMCSTESAKIAKLQRKIQDTELRSITDDIEDAIINDSYGFQGGTDEEKLFGAFKKLESGTASDFCALVAYYNKNSNSGDLFDDLDSDIEAESEWKQIYRPIRNCVEDSLLSLEETSPNKTSERQNNINNIYCGLKNGLISNPGSKLNGTKWEDYVKSYQVTNDEIKVAQNSCPKIKTRTRVPIPGELVNADGVKKFQDWLDSNHPGWATGYKDGILKQGQNGGGYGKFGPRTQKAWNNEQWRQEYLSGKSQPTSNPTVPPKPVDDGSTSVEGDDANNVLNQ